MKWLHWITWALVMIGGLNWLLIGIGGFAGADWNVVGMIFSSWWPQGAWVVYILVGLSAIYEIVMHKSNCKMCSTSMKSSSMPGSTM